MGADVVSFAVPRQFGASTADILHYCATVATATPLPILIQDFNPGGPTIGAEFVSDLLGRADNFRFLKLEDPMMLDKLIAIRSETAGRISILEGWGGLYMLEGIAAGIDGIMPGAAIADLLDTVLRAAVSQQRSRAHDLFGSLLPFVSFALQDFELFLQIEKRTLSRRGLIASPTVRSLSSTPSPAVLAHVDFLIDQVERLASRGVRQALVENQHGFMSAVIEVSEYRPRLQQRYLQGGACHVVEQDGEHLAGACGGRSADCLKAVLMRPLADVLCESMIVACQILTGDVERFEALGACEVEHAPQTGVDHPQLTGQESLDVDALSLGLAVKLARGARTVEHRYRTAKLFGGLNRPPNRRAPSPLRGSNPGAWLR